MPCKNAPSLQMPVIRKTRQPCGVRAYSLRAADFDGDEDIDVLIAKNTGGGDWYIDFTEIFMLKNQGDGSFQATGTLIKRGEVTKGFVPNDHRINARMAIGDFDLDNDTDLATIDYSGIVEYFSNTGSGTFESQGEIFDFGFPCFETSGLLSIDEDKDGDLEILVSHGNNLEDVELHSVQNHTLEMAAQTEKPSKVGYGQTTEAEKLPP